jgi:hypothetical protein
MHLLFVQTIISSSKICLFKKMYSMKEYIADVKSKLIKGCSKLGQEDLFRPPPPPERPRTGGGVGVWGGGRGAGKKAN